MNTLSIDPTKKSLAVKCESGHIEMNGCSITNDPRAFFNPIMTWVKEYIQSPAETTEVVCNFDYIDTASFKHLFTILKEFVPVNKNQKKVNVKWYFSYDDPEILELGEILQGRLDLGFEMVAQ